jgi:RNA polymerase-binding protein DksA
MQDRIEADRASTLERIVALERDFDRIVESTPEVTDDEHDPEGSTIAFERAQLTAVLDQARRHLEELDRALGRLRDGSYGTCVVCGAPIGAERLEARPVASTCIVCA